MCRLDMTILKSGCNGEIAENRYIRFFEGNLQYLGSGTEDVIFGLFISIFGILKAV